MLIRPERNSIWVETWFCSSQYGLPNCLFPQYAELCARV